MQIVIRVRGFNEQVPPANKGLLSDIKEISKSSSQKEIENFLNGIKTAFTTHPLILLEFCDDATGMLILRILHQCMGLPGDIYTDRSLVERVDRQPGDEMPQSNTLYIFSSPLGMTIPENDDTSIIDTIIGLWEADKISLGWIMVS